MKKLYILWVLAIVLFENTSNGQTTNILQTINTTCFNASNPPSYAKDASPTTYYLYSGYWGCPSGFRLELVLSKQAKVVRVEISSSQPGIKLDNYYTTTKITDQFYYVNPSMFNSLILTGTINWTEQKVFDIKVIEIPVENVALNYAYDSAGNMTSREIVIGSAKSAEMVSNDTTEIIGETTDDANSDSKNDAEMPDASTKNQFDEMLGNNGVTIYPNPTRGKLRVAINDVKPDDKVFVNVYSLAGTRIFTGELNDNLIDLNKEASGVYILTIVINDKSQNWRIVKE